MGIDGKKYKRFKRFIKLDLTDIKSGEKNRFSDLSKPKNHLL